MQKIHCEQYIKLLNKQLTFLVFPFISESKMTQHNTSLNFWYDVHRGFFTLILIFKILHEDIYLSGPIKFCSLEELPLPGLSPLQAWPKSEVGLSLRLAEDPSWHLYSASKLRMSWVVELFL